MNGFTKKVIKSYVIAAVSTMGSLTSTAIWNSGLNEKIKEVTRKHFNKNEES